MGKPIRVLVANRPRLMRELILEALADQPDIEIVGEVANDAQIADRVEQTLPDFLVIALDEPDIRPLLCETLLRHHPDMRIIAVAPDRNYSVYYWASLDIHSSDIEASEEGILGAVRSRTHLVGNQP